MTATEHGFFDLSTRDGAPVPVAKAERVAVTRLVPGVAASSPEGAEGIVVLMSGQARAGDTAFDGPRRVLILPPGTPIEVSKDAEAWLIAPRQTGDAAPWRALPGVGARCYEMDGLEAPADNPRLKMLMTDRLSINWVRYDGPRDRAKLSPHVHADFPQCGLALEGAFVHHMRTPWSRDADTWREDVHRDAPSPSLIDIPATVEHTSEGVGPGLHLLVDIFAPPRADYIGRGWMLNSADYEPAEG